MQALNSSRLQRRAAVGGRPGRKALSVRAAKTADGPTLAIAGITGAVGQEFLTVRVQFRLGRELSA
jgi:aspartate-semialdehyde dehydrogenase